MGFLVNSYVTNWKINMSFRVVEEEKNGEKYSQERSFCNKKKTCKCLWCLQEKFFPDFSVHQEIKEDTHTHTHTHTELASKELVSIIKK